MPFRKKILILKQVAEGYSAENKKVSGIVRVEKDSGISEISFSPVNFVFNNRGEYLLFIFDGKTRVNFPLGPLPSSFTKESDETFPEEFCTGVFFIQNDLPELIAYAKTDNSKTDRTDLKKAIAEELMEKRKIEKRAEESLKKDNDDLNKTPEKIKSNAKNVYNDEAVATEDYFNEDLMEEKLKIISLMDENYVRTENAMSSFGDENKTEKKESFFDRVKDETNGNSCEKFSEEHPYFDTVKDELDGLFMKFPEESSLSQCVANSRWARIYYSDEKYYVVGVIKEKGREKYICYGVPDFYSSAPPKELDGFCSFVPISVFDLKGKGFWMMFQDAITGKCIKK